MKRIIMMFFICSLTGLVFALNNCGLPNQNIQASRPSSSTRTVRGEKGSPGSQGRRGGRGSDGDKGDDGDEGEKGLHSICFDLVNFDVEYLQWQTETNVDFHKDTTAPLDHGEFYEEIAEGITGHTPTDRFNGVKRLRQFLLCHEAPTNINSLSVANTWADAKGSGRLATVRTNPEQIFNPLKTTEIRKLKSTLKLLDISYNGSDWTCDTVSGQTIIKTSKTYYDFTGSETCSDHADDCEDRTEFKIYGTGICWTP